ncbi:hypothetical protein FIBSPDRAFT_483004 [Athelia psychrophila]|uniref:Secreted protein n=1 Tax=Athelia psychrophila TaxID=1759441 RepID=A0A166L0X0_9AGAM|nr:hypothetical protein FIBSPDRAFT_483004 [Fibularhizoctonia sp. CBS 109695]
MHSTIFCPLFSFLFQLLAVLRSGAFRRRPYWSFLEVEYTTTVLNSKPRLHFCRYLLLRLPPSLIPRHIAIIYA